MTDDEYRSTIDAEAVARARHTHIELSRPVFGRRRFVVLDRIGSGSDLDVFNPSERTCIDYGRQRIGYVVTR